MSTHTLSHEGFIELLYAVLEQSIKHSANVYFGWSTWFRRASGSGYFRVDFDKQGNPWRIALLESSTMFACGELN